MISEDGFPLLLVAKAHSHRAMCVLEQQNAQYYQTRPGYASCTRALVLINSNVPWAACPLTATCLAVAVCVLGGHAANSRKERNC